MGNFCIAISCVSMATALFSTSALAQRATPAFPSKPVTLIVGLAAGGPVDLEARMYAKKLSESMKQSFVIDAKPGGASVIAASYVAKAMPDGHTLLIVSTAFTLFPTFAKDLAFDPIKDFAPVSQMSNKVTILLVHPSFPAKTFDEYIAYSKGNPGKVNYGVSGAGSIAHLAGEWLHNATHTKVTFVAYKGGGPMLNDLVAGRLSVGSTALLGAIPLIKSGKLLPLAIMGSKRTELLPSVPTIAERGVPGYDYSTWLGISAPGKTPTEIINKLNEEIVAAVKSPDVIAALKAQGSEPVGSKPAEFRQVIISEMARWKKVAIDAGIKKMK